MIPAPISCLISFHTKNIAQKKNQLYFKIIIFSEREILPVHRNNCEILGLTVRRQPIIITIRGEGFNPTSAKLCELSELTSIKSSGKIKITATHTGQSEVTVIRPNPKGFVKSIITLSFGYVNVKGNDVIMKDERTLTKGEMIAEIMRNYDKLNDENKAEFRKVVYEMYQTKLYEKLKKVLRQQSCPNDGSLFKIRDFVLEEKQKNEFKSYEDFMMFSDIFEYGRIYGIKQERARRKGIKNFYVDNLVELKNGK